MEEEKVTKIIRKKVTKKVVKELPRANFAGERVLIEINDETRELIEVNMFGTSLGKDRAQLSFHDALFLLEKNKVHVVDGRNKVIDFDRFVKKAKKLEPNFWVRYSVYRDLRQRGYIAKTALKFGADFRVYDRGVKPGEDHARWIVYPVHEGEMLTWYDFAAKNRVAHSTKKRLMIGIVDDEADVTYYEVKWMRP